MVIYISWKEVIKNTVIIIISTVSLTVVFNKPVSWLWKRKHIPFANPCFRCDVISHWYVFVCISWTSNYIPTVTQFSYAVHCRCIILSFILYRLQNTVAYYYATQKSYLAGDSGHMQTSLAAIIKQTLCTFGQLMHMQFNRIRERKNGNGVKFEQLSFCLFFGQMQLEFRGQCTIYIGDGGEGRWGIFKHIFLMSNPG